MSDDKRIAELERELAALRELMNCYNLGGWTDANAAMKRALAAEAELAEMTRERDTARAERDEARMDVLDSPFCDEALRQQQRAEIAEVNLAATRARADALAGTLSRILAAVAPKDVKLADGRTMRFVPPDPEAYWRALSDAIDAAIDAARGDKP